MKSLTHIFEYAPKDIWHMIMKKIPPTDLISLCGIKNKDIRRLCYNEDFIEKYADLHKDELEELLISFSMEGKHRELLHLLTIFGNHINPGVNEDEAMMTASYHGHHKVIELLLQDGRADPAMDNNFPIRIASQNGHVKVVELLLQDSRVNPKDNASDAIVKASEFGRYEVVKVLLEDGRANPAEYNNEAILAASHNGHKDIVELLLKDDRVDPNSV